MAPGQPKRDRRAVLDSPRGLEGRVENATGIQKTAASQLRVGYASPATMAKKETLANRGLLT